MEQIPQAPQFEGGDAKTERDHDLNVRNMVQLMLAEKHSDTLLSFIHEHAKAIGDLFERYPGLYDFYDRNPDGVIEYIEKELGLTDEKGESEGQTLH
jgi:hypothetical protein